MLKICGRKDPLWCMWFVGLGEFCAERMRSKFPLGLLLAITAELSWWVSSRKLPLLEK